MIIAVYFKKFFQKIVYNVDGYDAANWPLLFIFQPHFDNKYTVNLQVNYFM